MNALARERVGCSWYRRDAEEIAHGDEDLLQRVRGKKVGVVG